MKIPLSIFLLAVGICCYAQPSQPERANDPTLRKLNGKVASLRQTMEPGRDDTNTTQYFEGDNRLTKISAYDKSQVFVYDSIIGVLTTMTVLDRKGRETNRTTYVYNEKKELLQLKMQSESGSGDYEITREYKNGMMISESFVYTESNASINTQWRYDSKGNLAETIKDTPTLMSMASHERSVYEYDKSGRVAKETNYEGKPETLSYARSFKYDAKGNLAETMLRHPVPSPYDYVMRYKYDVDNNLIDYVTDGKDDKIDDHLTYEYEFDSQKNVVHKRVYQNGELITDLKRQITYR